MTAALATIGILALCVGSFGAGAWFGVRHAVRRAAADAERYARLMGEPYRGSEAHNFNGEPARVTQGRIRNRRTFKLHD